MIVELADGREFRLPDGTQDEEVDGFVKALMFAEAKATEALRKVEELSKRPPPKADDKGYAEMAAALRALSKDIRDGFQEMIRAQLADTVIVQRNNNGDPVRSTKVVK